MSRANRRRAGASLLLLAVLFMVVATFVVGCGSGGDKYEGSWIQESVPGIAPQPPIVIKKVGEQYTVTAQGAGAQGYMLHDTVAEGSSWSNVYPLILAEDTKATKDGDKLKFQTGDSTVEITVSGGKMTITVPGVNGVYAFSRVAAK